MKNIEKLRKVFSEALGLDIAIIVPDLTYGSLAQWDSIAHMSLVAQMEEDFDIMLDTDEIIDMSSFQVACNILEKHNVDIES
ncbi:acyl carrier protein [Amylibacter sp.]|jgi:acyl carrier protein|nr:acyl carrier protein [Amylibacter sp.]